MKSGRILRLAIVVIFLLPMAAKAQFPAFPGADGAGAVSTGGRGGTVYHVTKLDQNYNDAVPGTLRYGMNNANFPGTGHRTIVFDVAGTFWLGRFGAELGHDNGWDTNSRINLGSNITVAGQTAPGPVYIMGGTVKSSSSNVILRNISIAPGYGMRSFEKPDEAIPVIPFGGDATHTRDFPDSYVYDAIDISASNQLIIDHVSTFYATDETISANELGNNVTIQYSNISQGLNYPQGDAEGSGITYTGHALGSLLQGGTDAKFSVHHNLYAHQKGRLPRVGSEVGTGAYNDFRNNVFYNWLGTAGGGAGGQPSFNNFVGNFYLAGPGGDDLQQTNGPNGIPRDGDDVVTIVNANGGTGAFSGSNATGTRIYQSGNLRDTNKDGEPNDGTLLVNSNFGSASFQAGPVWVGGVTNATYKGVTDTATDAFSRVLNYMGANWWTRDYTIAQNNVAAINTPDERMIHETYTGTGKIMAWNDDPFNDYAVPPAGYDAYNPTEGAEWRSLLALRADTVTGAAPFNRDTNWDTDQDGMPNTWEAQHGLNPNVAENNGDFDSDGYTNIEEYINDLAAWPAPNTIVFNGSTSNRYAQITNWDANPAAPVDTNMDNIPDVMNIQNWQPSRYDTALINGFTTIFVDAVGQHAGNLILGTDASDAPTLNITSGWIKVADAPAGLNEGVTVIGDNPGSEAVLNLSGGKLRTETLLKGDLGTFNFTGGTLSADTVGFTLVNNGGTIAPGESAGKTHVVGDLTLNSGALEIEIGGTDPLDYDKIEVNGLTTLGGTLRVKLIDPLGGNTPFVPALDNQFAFLVTGSFDEMEAFEAIEYPDLPEGLAWELTPGTTTFLTIIEADTGLAGDFNGDGTVDAADYTVWRNNFGDADETNINDNGDGGDIGTTDYDLWKEHYGDTDMDLGGGGIAGNVPEPASLILLLAGAVALCCGRRACR